jgi:hypothetical protein
MAAATMRGFSHREMTLEGTPRFGRRVCIEFKPGKRKSAGKQRESRSAEMIWNANYAAAEKGIS